LFVEKQTRGTVRNMQGSKVVEQSRKLIWAIIISCFVQYTYRAVCVVEELRFRGVKSRGS
jgi:hypothetical protein